MLSHQWLQTTQEPSLQQRLHFKQLAQDKGCSNGEGNGESNGESNIDSKSDSNDASNNAGNHGNRRGSRIGGILRIFRRGKSNKSTSSTSCSSSSPVNVDEALLHIAGPRQIKPAVC